MGSTETPQAVDFFVVTGIAQAVQKKDASGDKAGALSLLRQNAPTLSKYMHQERQVALGDGYENVVGDTITQRPTVDGSITILHRILPPDEGDGIGDSSIRSEEVFIQDWDNTSRTIELTRTIAPGFDYLNSIKLAYPGGQIVCSLPLS